MKSRIEIPSGFAIGYPKSLGAGEELRLAEAEEKIELGVGRHLLLARNGRGKTTLLRTLSRTLAPLSGSYSIDGTVQYLDEELRFDEELRVRSILKALFRREARKTAFELAERLELDVAKPYGKLSKGNRQKVGLIIVETRLMQSGAHVAFLDEPFSGLDFHVRAEVDRIWNEHPDEVLRLVCVHPDEPTLQADSVVLITDGKLVNRSVDGSVDWMETRKTLS